MDNHRFKIIYEDDYLIVVNKAPGLLVIPSPKKERHTLTSLLNEMLAQRGLEIKVHPCHRLDRDTSGVIIYAKGKKNQQLVMEQFKKQKVKKEYIAFAQGNIKKESGEIKSHIDDTGREKPKLAITQYRVDKRSKSFTVVRVRPVTGRTNQIRIHFKEMGHPLLGERRFAFAKDYVLRFRRPALHALNISLRHPGTGGYMTFSAPLAEDMEEFLLAHQ